MPTSIHAPRAGRVAVLLAGDAPVAPSYTTLTVRQLRARLDPGATQGPEQGSYAQGTPGQGWDAPSCGLDDDPLDTLILHRIVQSVPVSELMRVHELVRARCEDREDLPIVANYFLAGATAAKDPTALIDQLSKLPGVARAFVVPEVADPPSGSCPVDPPRFAASQLYLQPAPVGIGARAVRRLIGGTGAGVAFADVEGAWHMEERGDRREQYVSHCDLPESIPLIFGVSDINTIRYVKHGMAALGVVLARDDGDAFGEGIAPDASPTFVSATSGLGGTTFSDAIPEGAPTERPSLRQPRDIWNGLAAAIWHLYARVPGKDGRLGEPPLPAVILLEQQVEHRDRRDEDSGWAEAPVETDSIVGALLRYAAGLGVAVIEPAGDSSLNLNDVEDSEGRALVRPELGMRSPTGAVLVGGGYMDPSTRAWTGAASCVVGGSLSFFAQGSPAASTLGYEGEETASAATDNGFNATSLASAIVAGALVVARALALSLADGPRELDDLVDLLQRTGTAPDDASRDLIGRMPNLAAFAVELGLAPLLYMRDYRDDDGTPHDRTPNSYDLFVLDSRLDDRERSAYERDGRLARRRPGATAVRGATSYVYLRIFSRDSERQQATVTVYRIPSGSLRRVDHWPSIGALGPVTIEAGVGPVLLGPIEWTLDRDEPGTSVRLVAIVATDTFPEPGRDDVHSVAALKLWTRRHPSVTLRQVTLRDPS